MIGEYITTEQDCRRKRVAEDSIGLGSYNMDSHNVQRYITEEKFVQNEGNLEFTPGGPYSELYRQLLQEGQQLDVYLDEWLSYLPEDI